MDYHALSIDELLLKLKTRKDGLLESEVQERLTAYGLNSIEESESLDRLKEFFLQFSSPLIWILIFAAIISFIFGNYVDGTIILIILIINSMIGYFKQIRTLKILLEVDTLNESNIKVIRSGKLISVSSKKLVPGDIIVLNAGDKIPVDARVISSKNLMVRESIFGNEQTLRKGEMPVAINTPEKDRKNMLYATSMVVKGQCEAVVTHTGEETQVGRLVYTSSKKEYPGFLDELSSFSKLIALIVLIMSATVFAVGVLRLGLQTETVTRMLLISVALAVAAVPEGLPTVARTTLAISVRRLLKENILVRKLKGLEIVGKCDVICIGIKELLSENLEVTKVFMGAKLHDVKDVFDNKDAALLFTAGLLCNDITGEDIKDSTNFVDKALIESAVKNGLDVSKIKSLYQKVDEVSFSNERKFKTTVYALDNRMIAYSNGYGLAVLDVCDKMLIGGQIKNLTEELRDYYKDVYYKLSKQGYQVMGFSYKDIKSNEKIEENMVFLGFQALEATIDLKTKDAALANRHAGIHTVILTGQDQNTAGKLAVRLGLIGKTMSGKELSYDKITDTHEYSVFAELEDGQKERILKKFQELGHNVLFIGSDISEVKSMEVADIAVTTHYKGTDATKEVADLILKGSGYMGITNSIGQGRTLIKNIKKFTRYLLSANVGEVLTVFSAVIAGLRAPVFAIQLLWMNLITDGLPAISLGLEKHEKDNMEEQFLHSKIIDKSTLIFTVIIGLSIAVITLGVYLYILLTHGWTYSVQPSKFVYQYATTMAFSTLMVTQLFNIFNNRSLHGSMFNKNFFSNPWLFISIGISLAMQILIVSIPSIANIFHAVVLSFSDWSIIIGVSLLIIVIGEIYKVIVR